VTTPIRADAPMMDATRAGCEYPQGYGRLADVWDLCWRVLNIRGGGVDAAPLAVYVAGRTDVVPDTVRHVLNAARRKKLLEGAVHGPRDAAPGARRVRDPIGGDPVTPTAQAGDLIRRYLAGRGRHDPFQPDDARRWVAVAGTDSSGTDLTAPMCGCPDAQS
jgi:hypothetical protein